MYSNIICYFIILIPVLINVAFITLLERKILGYSQLRKGPNKVSFIGIAQPFSDAIKLFSNEIILPFYSNKKQFFFSPLMALSIVMITFSFYPLFENNLNLSFGVLFVYMMMSMNVYPLIISGWSSNSKYALIGSMRGIAQTISYEVMFALVLLFFLILSKSMNILTLVMMNYFWVKSLIFLPLVGIIFISALAETNRTPFDFAEGESELVSGFNVEYGSLNFALIFMAEYASILLISCFLVSLMFYFSSFIMISITVLVLGGFIWMRTTFPRYRYDKLMNLAWKVYLPLSLFSLLLPLMIILV